MGNWTNEWQWDKPTASILLVPNLWLGTKVG